jgi:hypothetical protein
MVGANLNELREGIIGNEVRAEARQEKMEAFLEDLRARGRDNSLTRSEKACLENAKSSLEEI